MVYRFSSETSTHSTSKTYKELQHGWLTTCFIQICFNRFTELVPTNSVWSPGFTEELLPTSKQISLLYHISYLCLAKFPNLERLLRKRAVETQLLFGSSEALLLKIWCKCRCMGTSQTLVSSLFPMLIHAIEKNKPTLVCLMLCQDVSALSNLLFYVQHNGDVATTTSDIITEKANTEAKSEQLSQEVQEMEGAIKTLEEKLAGVRNKLEDTKRKIDAKNLELESYVRDVTSKSSGLRIFAAIVPFIGRIVKSIYDAATSPAAAAKIKALENRLNQLTSQKTALMNQEWSIEVQQMDLQMKLAKVKIDKGSIPSPVHLNEVQRYLTKIQNIVIQIKNFWQKVHSMLGVVQKKTFVNEDLVDEPERKEEFVNSIQKPSEIWSMFGCSCGKAAEIFKIQSKDAYAFLEIDPSSLSDAVWQEEYNSVMGHLQEMKVLIQTPAAIQN
ncbi:hypothetical protein P4O66_019904 [Electrophorus voltai]|uniref:Uncharacterized protein n=1 Tax=Electrophorus voltai TaxID=2609070 RepID=A0AAD8ZUT6_9TELE|nr:hypothetical protein P4O66_019904 [Electrophorus voltai]